MRRKLALTIVICVVVIGVVVGIVFTRGGSPELPKNTAVVTRGNIAKTVVVDGTLEMPNKATLSFGVTGTVKEVLVAEGSKVTKGQVLAKVDAPALAENVEIARERVKIAERQVRIARARYERARQEWNEAYNVTPERWRELEEKFYSARRTWEEEKLALRKAKLDLESAKRDLEKAVIVAPFDGVVTSITITEGREITAATLATSTISLLDTTKIEMRAFVDERDVAMIKVGQVANITLDALPDLEMEGRVGFVSLLGTSRGGVVSYAATITLNNATEGLRDGMSASARIIIERRDNVLLIPNRAIRGTLKDPRVLVLVGWQVEERRVTLGLTDGTKTEVVSGLEEGEKVVLPPPRPRPDDLFGR